MKAIGKYWKLILAFLLLIGAVLVFVLQYLPAKTAYELERAALQTQIGTMQVQIAENQKYAPYQDQLEEATREIEESRADLYGKFPVELKEEDQIMYMLYLEEKFGREVVFSFAEEVPIVGLSDGAQLQGVTFAFDFATTYGGFKKMVEELATDSVITSVRYAVMQYDAQSDQVIGQLIVTRYVMNEENKTDGREYQAPEVDKPALGKENIYQK